MKMDQYFIMFTRGKATVKKTHLYCMNSLLCWMAILVTEDSLILLIETQIQFHLITGGELSLDLFYLSILFLAEVIQQANKNYH